MAEIDVKLMDAINSGKADKAAEVLQTLSSDKLHAEDEDGNALYHAAKAYVTAKDLLSQRGELSVPHPLLRERLEVCRLLHERGVRLNLGKSSDEADGNALNRKLKQAILDDGDLQVLVLL